MPGARMPEAERFFTYVEPTGFCWLWMGYKNPMGYGKFNTGSSRETKSSEYAHRWVYAHLIGPIPAGLTLDHLCRNPACVNPDHLEPVTQQENNRRKPASVTCLRGHDLSEAYVRSNGDRMCVPCLRITAAHRESRLCKWADCDQCRSKRAA